MLQQRLVELEAEVQVATYPHLQRLPIALDHSSLLSSLLLLHRDDDDNDVALSFRQQQ